MYRGRRHRARRLWRYRPRRAFGGRDDARDEGHQGGPLAPHHPVAVPDEGHRRPRAGSAKAFLTVEMNMGQMVDDVRLAVERPRPGATSTAAPAASSPRPAEVLGADSKQSLRREVNNDGREKRRSRVVPAPDALPTWSPTTARAARTASSTAWWPRPSTSWISKAAPSASRRWAARSCAYDYLRLRHDRGGARPRSRGGHRREARSTRQRGVHLSGRRRPGLHRHGRDRARRRPAARTSPSSSSTTPSTA